MKRAICIGKSSNNGVLNYGITGHAFKDYLGNWRFMCDGPTEDHWVSESDLYFPSE